jgi:hypothetical protein
LFNGSTFIIESFRRLPFLTPNVVINAFHTFLFGAVSRAEKVFLCLHAMPYNLAPAIRANGREPVNRAFKRIENVAFSCRDNLKSQIIIITANFTLRHFCYTPYFNLP